MIHLKSFIFNPFQVNSFVLYDDSLKCIIIDASCYHKEEYQELYSFISGKSLEPIAVLNTHGHVDHLTGTAQVCEKYNIGLYIHHGDLGLLDDVVDYGKTFGLQVIPPPKPGRFLEDGEIFKFGNSEITAWHTPGHSPGSMVFYSPGSKFIITGDVLFAGSIGRTDLPGGDYNQLISSIRTKILVLPGETRVFPGHGPGTTIAAEAMNNPFLTRSF